MSRQHTKYFRTHAIIKVVSHRPDYDESDAASYVAGVIGQGLEPPRMRRELVMPEIAGTHARRDHQIIEGTLRIPTPGQDTSTDRPAKSTPVTSPSITLTFFCT